MDNVLNNPYPLWLLNIESKKEVLWLGETSRHCAFRWWVGKLQGKRSATVVKNEDIIWYEHVRETGTGAMTGVDKKADDRQNYMRYGEELDGAVDERKDDGEQQIVTLEESTCTESEPELDMLYVQFERKDNYEAYVMTHLTPDGEQKSMPLEVWNQKELWLVKSKGSRWLRICPLSPRKS